VERVGNAYRVTDKVNIPELQSKLQRRIDMVTETAKRLAKAVRLVVLPEVHRTLVALTRFSGTSPVITKSRALL
jgi:hypothetical protein